MNRKHAKGIGIFLLKLAGTTLFLFWALSMIEDKKALGDNFRHALRSPAWVAAGISMAFLCLLANAFRWFFVLKAQDIRLPFSYIFRLTLYGAFFNIASFGSAAGDAAKIVLLMRRVPDKKVGVTISVMVDHVIGFISSGTIFLVFAWGLGTADQAKDIAGRNAFIAATWFQAGGLIGIFLTVLSCTPGMLAWGRRNLPRLTNNRWVDKISTVIDMHRVHWRYAVWSLCASFVLSASFYLTFFAAVRSLGEQVEAATILSVMPVVDVVSSLPISISGLGVRERTFDFLISQLTGIPPAATVAAALIGFLFSLFWGIVGGLAIITARHHRKTETIEECNQTIPHSNNSPMIQDLVISLRTLIHEQLFPLDDTVTGSSDLHDAGLDSLALMQLILLVEKEYSVKITPDDLDRENFSSLEKLAEMIARKKI